MDALNILDAVRDPIVYSQKIGTAQGGKELNLMICMNMNINSGKSEEIFPPANCARHTCCSHLPTSCAAIINADVIYHHFMCSYSVIVAGYQPGGIKIFWRFLQLYIFHDVLNSVGLFYQAQALHESFNVDQPPPGREE